MQLIIDALQADLYFRNITLVVGWKIDWNEWEKTVKEDNINEYGHGLNNKTEE